MFDSTVSVIFTVLNEAQGIQILLEALLSQSRLPDEIVIVDGGSNDQTIDIMKRYVQEHSRIRLLVRQGVNIARGRNIAIHNASCPIIAVTDGGCRPHSDWLKELVRPLLEDETVGAVSGAIQVDARTRLEVFSGLLSTPKDDGNSKRRMFFGRSCAFRKSVWESVGGYPEWLYTAEDTLFALRARKEGCKIAYAPDSILNWCPRSTLYKIAKQFFLYGRGNGRINLGDTRGSIYWMRYHFLWLVTMMIGIIFPWVWIVTGVTLIYLYFIMILPILRKKRSEVQDSRRGFYIPLILFTRNIFSNAGYLVGAFEYHNIPLFRKNLKMYYSGNWKCNLE